MSWVKAYNFAKYFCVIYSEYISPCTVMTYATSDVIWAMPLRVRTLHSRAMVWSGWVDNTMNGSQEKIG
jgi:hypothetical protein